ncbi:MULTISPECIES: hypothetical protein, partial [Pirellulaceae]|uniref:hypothetical protein n=1 Tax=Pirellulaceae TaxID=2691357 RepID=UPI001BDFF2E1
MLDGLVHLLVEGIERWRRSLFRLLRFLQRGNLRFQPLDLEIGLADFFQQIFADLSNVVGVRRGVAFALRGFVGVGHGGTSSEMSWCGPR